MIDMLALLAKKRYGANVASLYLMGKCRCWWFADFAISDSGVEEGGDDYDAHGV